MPRRKAQSELTPRTIALRVVYFLENNSWVAQCLEYDVAAQGKTLSEVEDAFRKTITGQIILDLRNGKDPFDGIKPAPRLYWQKFNEGYKLGVEKNIDLPPNVPPAFLVEAITRETRVNG